MAIVTGGSRGVGLAVVRCLAVRAYALVVNYLHDQRAAESTVEMILADNGAAVAIRADGADGADELDLGKTLCRDGLDLRRRRRCCPCRRQPGDGNSNVRG